MRLMNKILLKYSSALNELVRICGHLTTKDTGKGGGGGESCIWGPQSKFPPCLGGGEFQSESREDVFSREKRYFEGTRIATR